MIEAIFLVRAYRTTLPRFGYSEPIDTAKMEIQRRISATFKDLPGGQILGPTFDYTHRLVDFDDAETAPPASADDAGATAIDAPHVMQLLDNDGLVERNITDDEDRQVGDITREPLSYPADRDIRLQNLARGDEGFLLALGSAIGSRRSMSKLKSFGRIHRSL